MGYIPPPPAVYENPKPSIIVRSIFIILSIILVFTGFFILFTFDWMKNIGIFLFSFIGPLIYLELVWRKDKYEPEPLYYVMFVVALGIVIGIPVLFTELVFSLNSFIDTVLTAPIVEEFFKGLAIYVMSKRKEFNDAMDGIVYGFGVGMGFAIAENFGYIIYVYKIDPLYSFLRVFLFCIGHGVYTSLLGYVLGKQKSTINKTTLTIFISGLFLPVISHAMYNLLPFLAKNSLEALITIILYIIILLLILSRLIKNSLKMEKKWGYDKGYAPK